MIPRLLLTALCLCSLITPAPAAGRNQPLAVFHLEPHPGGTAMMTLRASVRGHEGRFMFDTGGGILYISPSYAQTVGGNVRGQLTGFVLTGQRRDKLPC